MKNQATDTAVKQPNMDSLLAFLNSAQTQASLRDIRRGIERELVRVTPQGQLSERSHPTTLGSALLHPYITTDFAEAQLELVTSAVNKREKTFTQLSSLHHFVAANLADSEMMWGASMPPILPAEHNIDIASYGSSNAALVKSRYRQGLANRYGKRMQLISGIHYNFSLPDSFWQALHVETKSDLPLQAFISERYFHLIRNVLRHGWIIPYLFGASPAADKSYLQGHSSPLSHWDKHTEYLPWATSLRLSNLGYGSSEQSNFPISFNNKNAYLSGLCNALTSASQQFSHLSQKQQLNTSVLQLENELYGSVRPKIVNTEMRPLVAMCNYGVQYIELRSLDNNPLLPLGLDTLQSQFIDLFLIYSALAPSPEMSEQERMLIMDRQELVATQGRKPGLLLPTMGGAISLVELATPLMDALEEMAQGISHQHQDDDYRAAIKREKAKFEDSNLTPSAQILTSMKREGLSHTAFIKARSQSHMQGYLANVSPAVHLAELERLTTQSLQKQQQLEATQDVSFADYVTQKSLISCDMQPQVASTQATSSQSHQLHRNQAQEQTI